jgi:hypothetical protein
MPEFDIGKIAGHFGAFIDATHDLIRPDDRSGSGPCRTEAPENICAL